MSKTRVLRFSSIFTDNTLSEIQIFLTAKVKFHSKINFFFIFKNGSKILQQEISKKSDSIEKLMVFGIIFQATNWSKEQNQTSETRISLRESSLEFLDSNKG